LDEPWFALPPPKSTGREVFHLDWVQARLQGTEAAADVQATLLELTAASGWLPHTTRAAITGLRKRGHDVRCKRVDGVSRYTITSDSK